MKKAKKSKTKLIYLIQTWSLIGDKMVGVWVYVGVCRIYSDNYINTHTHTHRQTDNLFWYNGRKQNE